MLRSLQNDTRLDSNAQKRRALVYVRFTLERIVTRVDAAYQAAYRSLNSLQSERRGFNTGSRTYYAFADTRRELALSYTMSFFSVVSGSVML